MEIISISVNGMELILGTRKDNTTSWYELFMEFCIANHKEKILSGNWLSEKFSQNPEHPAFGRAIHYKRVRNFNGVYYHNYNSNKEKYNLINRIGDELLLNFRVIISDNAQK